MRAQHTPFVLRRKPCSHLQDHLAKRGDGIPVVPLLKVFFFKSDKIESHVHVSMYSALLVGRGSPAPPFPPTKGNPVAYAHPSSHHQEMDHSFLPSSGYAPVNRLTQPASPGDTWVYRMGVAGGGGEYSYEWGCVHCVVGFTGIKPDGKEPILNRGRLILFLTKELC